MNEHEHGNFVPAMYGSKVFNDGVMQTRLPKDVYKSLRDTIAEGAPVQLDMAYVVASVMRDWAVENGATHFTHWFQPMTGITAEKHDSFISPSEGGRAIMEFSGKELVKGEPDASSFPSGGLRATFEARGYTAWDPTSYAFIKESTLYIPTAFCSYGGEALDKKTPLLRSIQALNKQALRVLKLFGDSKTARVTSTAGPEQEYFLVDKSLFLQRPDLMFCGRTLCGARPPKGQELEDHYFGSIKPRVSAFMRDLDAELWTLGVPAKTKHNEVAPGQHELALIYSSVNSATDHNQLTMELMKSVADKHNFACLLHEKPFAGVNGSGKHNNWSMSTDEGRNLLDPGDSPFQNAQFLLFLSAVIKAVDEYQSLLRVSVASAGNDHRLGANEAPPAIVSIFLGDELTEVLSAFESGKNYAGKKKCQMEIGVGVLPHFAKDTTDRNRTSPFAFTGNKFEFRMPGSSFSIAGPNTVLNTIVAEELGQFADALEKVKAADFKKELGELIKKTVKEHKRIIFNGNNYSDEWIKEAKKRGLLNLQNTVEALPRLVDEKNIKVFTKHGVYTETELRANYEILLENYCKTVNIEALTLIDMIKKGFIGAYAAYADRFAKLISHKKGAGLPAGALEENMLKKLSDLGGRLYARLGALEDAVIGAKSAGDSLREARYYRENVVTAMSEARFVIDELETLTDAAYWPYPTYAELLSSET